VHWKWICLVLLAVNLVTFCLYAIDKLLAKKNARRIRESTLLLFSALGGSIGAMLGMYWVRHKTKHAKFYICVPLFLVIHLGLLIALCIL